MSEHSPRRARRARLGRRTAAWARWPRRWAWSSSSSRSSGASRPCPSRATRSPSGSCTAAPTWCSASRWARWPRTSTRVPGRLAVGVDINATHTRSATSGHRHRSVHARAPGPHASPSTRSWSPTIRDAGARPSGSRTTSRRCRSTERGIRSGRRVPGRRARSLRERRVMGERRADVAIRTLPPHLALRRAEAGTHRLDGRRAVRGAASRESASAPASCFGATDSWRPCRMVAPTAGGAPAGRRLADEPRCRRTTSWVRAAR